MMFTRLLQFAAQVGKTTLPAVLFLYLKRVKIRPDGGNTAGIHSGFIMKKDLIRKVYHGTSY